MTKQEKEDIGLLAEYEVEKWRWLFNLPLPKFLSEMLDKHFAKKITVLYDRIAKKRQEQKEGGKMIKRKFYLYMN